MSIANLALDKSRRDEIRRNFDQTLPKISQILAKAEISLGISRWMMNQQANSFSITGHLHPANVVIGGGDRQRCDSGYVGDWS